MPKILIRQALENTQLVGHPSLGAPEPMENWREDISFKSKDLKLFFSLMIFSTTCDQISMLFLFLFLKVN
jgi:hypothetical protein